MMSAGRSEKNALYNCSLLNKKWFCSPLKSLSLSNKASKAVHHGSSNRSHLPTVYDRVEV